MDEEDDQHVLDAGAPPAGAGSDSTNDRETVSNRERLPLMPAMPPAADTAAEKPPSHETQLPNAPIRGVQVDEREVLFLIANYLEKREESKQAAQILIADLSASDALGDSISWSGAPKSLTYADYKRRHRDLGPDHLLHVLKTALTVSSGASTVHGSEPTSSMSLLLKSRARANRVALTPDQRKAMETELIDNTLKLRALQRKEAMVRRIVSKYDRLKQFLEDSRMESLPWDVQAALQSTTGTSVNLTALAADVRAVRQLLQVREEKAALQVALLDLLHRAKENGALQSTARTGRNHLSRLHRREITMQATPPLPPAYIYSRIRRLKTLNGHLLIPAYCMTYDKSGKFAITGADDRLIKIWSLRAGDLRFSLRGHVGNITDLAVNHSNTLLASSSDDKTVRVWELHTGAPVAVLLGHSSVVNSIRFHPTKNIVVTASDDGHCFCYKLPDITMFDELETKEQTAKRLLDQRAYLLTLRPAFSLSHAALRPNVRSNKVLCLSFSRCGRYVVTGGQDGMGRVWDVSHLSDPENSTSASDFTVAPQDLPAGPALQATNDAGQIDALTLRIEELVAPIRDAEAAASSVDNDAQAIQQPPPQPRTIPALPPVDTQQAATAGTDQRQQPRLAEVQQSRHVAVDIEQVTKVTEPIAQLKGHTGPVTNILFNHKGDMIATASIKDGTARVWQWEKKYKKITHKKLCFDENDRERELAAMYGLSSRKKTPPAVDTLTWTKNDDFLITLHSTKPDSGSGEGDWRQRMRIWNPVSGELEKTLSAVDPAKKNGHVNAVFAMDAHPTDPRIVITGGHDGRVIIWDISEGCILKSFVIMSPEGETVALLDGSFMPTGDGFCFTDRIGRLCIFGTGSGEHMAAVPVQQYLKNDYEGLITDRNFHVIDRETQRAPSLMEPGHLMDVFGVPYPLQPPHLLASRGAWTPEEYEEYRRKRVQQCIESEIANKVRHVPSEEDIDVEESFPLAVLKPPSPRATVSTPALLATASYRLNGDPVLQAEIMRRNWNRMRRNQQSRPRASPSSEERDTSILNLVISSEEDPSDEDFQAPAARNTEHDDGDEDDEEEDDSDEDSELDADDMLSDASDGPDGDRLRRRRARRPSSARGQRLGGEALDDDEGPAGVRARRSRAIARSRRIQDEDDEVEVFREEEDGEDGEGRLRRHTRGRSRSHSAETLESVADGVIVETNDGFIMGDNQLDKFDTSVTYDQMLQARIEQHAASGSSAEPPVIVCAFCGEGDDRGLLKLPGDAMGVHPLVYVSQRLFVHDQCTIASPLCFNRGGKWYNVTKEIRRGRSISCAQCKRRGATIGCNIERCPKSYHWKCAVSCGWSLNQIQFYCPEHAAQNGGQASGSTVADREMQHRFGLTFRRDWLQLTSLVGIYPYVPQAGDYVVYFPQGHSDFLRITELKEPAFLRQVARFVSLKCKVVNVTYAFPTLAEYRVGPTGQKAIQCDVELVVLAVPAAAFPTTRTQGDAEEKEEKEETEDVAMDTSVVFASDTTSFSKFVSVNKFLHPAMDAECERLTIKIRFLSNDVSTFLVLDHVYEAGISGEWQEGQRVRTPMIELDQGLQTTCSTSFGTILRIDPVPSSANPVVPTPWNSVFVGWDAEDEDDCSVSPWELEPATRAVFASKRERDNALVATRLFQSRRLAQHRRQLLANAITAAMDLSIAKDFVHPVGTEYADYWVTIPNPIDLTKIRDRVLLGYYRQLEAFIADVELLHRNCETYNVSTSSIAQSSRSVTTSILTNAQQIFPEFFASYARDRTTHAYPPNDFGTNDSVEEDEGDQLDFEEEGRLAPVAAPVVAQDTPEVQDEPAVEEAPVRLTRSTRSSAEPTATDDVSAADTPASPRVTTRDRAAAATPERSRADRRLTREQSDVARSPEVPKSSRKRQRPSNSPTILRFADVMQALTGEQRQAVEERATDDLHSLLRDFHEALMGADPYGVFAVPVTEEVAPGYFDVVHNPMDFGTILDTIERYNRFSRYFEDIELVFANAVTYNGWESEIGALVVEIQGYCVKFLLDAIGISVKTKPKARGSGRRVAESPMRQTVTKRKRRAVSDDDDEEDSWGSESSSSSSSEDADEDDDDVVASDDGSVDDEESEPESDLSDDDRPRHRRLTRGANKKAKTKATTTKKRDKMKRDRKPKRSRTSTW